MPLSLTTANEPMPAPQGVSQEELVSKSGKAGSAIASRIVAYTWPQLHSAPKLEYEQRKAKVGTEFRFQKGTLKLTLKQRIYYDEKLGACPKKIWLEHEQDHVADNVAILGKLEAELKKDKEFADILITPVWFPTSQFAAIQKKINDRIDVVFKRLTKDAVDKRDTSAEYDKVEARIAKEC